MQRPAGDWRKVLLVYILQLFSCKWSARACAPLYSFRQSTSLPFRTRVHLSPYACSSSFRRRHTSPRGLAQRRQQDRVTWPNPSSRGCRVVGRELVVWPGPRSPHEGPWDSQDVSSVDSPPTGGRENDFSWAKIWLDAIFPRPSLFSMSNVLAIGVSIFAILSISIVWHIRRGMRSHWRSSAFSDVAESCAFFIGHNWRIIDVLTLTVEKNIDFWLTNTET